MQGLGREIIMKLRLGSRSKKFKNHCSIVTAISPFVNMNDLLKLLARLSSRESFNRIQVVQRHYIILNILIIWRIVLRFYLRSHLGVTWECLKKSYRTLLKSWLIVPRNSEIPAHALLCSLTRQHKMRLYMNVSRQAVARLYESSQLDATPRRGWFRRFSHSREEENWEASACPSFLQNRLIW